jgi:hypothetical protein
MHETVILFRPTGKKNLLLIFFEGFTKVNNFYFVHKL